MAFKTPPTLNWLIDNYARRKSKLEDICQKLEHYTQIITSLQQEKQTLLDEMNSISQVMSFHEIPIEVEDIPSKRTYRKVTKQKHGAVTAAIYKALSYGEFKSTIEVFEFVSKELNVKFDDGLSINEFKIAIRYRLRNLRRSGKVERYSPPDKRTVYWKLI